MAFESKLGQLKAQHLHDGAVREARAGLRPYRHGGARIEVESTDDGRVLGHNYGHGGSGITLSWGSARHLVTLLGERLTGGRRVAVLGAGVMGLCTARLLQQAGHQVTLYAREFPPHTTSDLAGGLWAPTHIGEAAEPQLYRRILRWSYEMYREQIGPHYGVYPISLYEAEGSPHPLDPMPDWLVGEGCRMERFPFGPSSPGGVAWPTLLIETGVFLNRLMEEFRQAGGRTEQCTFQDLRQVLELDQDGLVNCLGLGARRVVDDRAVTPIKGQLLILDPLGERFVVDHAHGYAISRGDRLVLGGTFDEGVEDTQVCPEVSRTILEGNRHFFSTCALP